MTSPAALAVVVLNWRNSADTIECLESLAKSESPIDVIVVDNDSQDDSVAAIERTGLFSQLIRNPQNDGYAGGNNVGLRFALGSGYPFVGVLNNDTVIAPETFKLLVGTCTAANAKVAVSPRIMYADGPDRLWFAGGTVQAGLPRHLQPEEVSAARGLTQSETLTGCCIVASAETWREVGLFDEGYFLIFEDSDWSARALRAGVELLVNHDAVLWHKVSRSFVGGTMVLMSTYFYVRNGLSYHSRYQRLYLMHFLLDRVVRPMVSTRRGIRGRRRYIARAVTDWLRGRRGNASERTWARAREIAAGARL